MTQDTQNSTSGAPSDAPANPLAQLLASLRVGGQPLTEDQIAFAEQIASVVLGTAEAQRMLAETKRAEAEATLANMQSNGLLIQFQAMNREAKAQARLHDAPLRFHFNGAVTDESVDAIQRQMMQASDMYPGRPMVLYMYTPGGSVMGGMAKYDDFLILRSPPRNHHLTIVGLGEVASMGSVLIHAGDWAAMGPNARMLIHAPSGGGMQMLIDMWDQLAHRITARKHCKMNVRQLKAKVKKVGDYWLTAQQALALGFIDEIITIPDESVSTPPPPLRDPNRKISGPSAPAAVNFDGASEQQ